MAAAIIRPETPVDLARILGHRRKGNEFHGPCPSCGGDDRCWIKDADEAPGKALITCRRCDSNHELSKAISAVAGTDSTRTPSSPSTRPSPPPLRGGVGTEGKERSPEEAKPFSPELAAVWELAKPTSAPLRAYLMRRQVWTRPDAHPAIRWLPDGALPGLRIPPGVAGAVVYRFEIRGELVGVGLDAIRKDGTHPDERWRRTIGTKKGAVFYARKVPDPAVFVRVAEGELDAIALLDSYSEDEIRAAGMDSNLAAACADPEGRIVFVHADNDPAGRHAADYAAMDLAREGRLGGVLFPERGAKDEAEAALKRAHR